MMKIAPEVMWHITNIFCIWLTGDKGFRGQDGNNGVSGQKGQKGERGFNAAAQGEKGDPGMIVWYSNWSRLLV